MAQDYARPVRLAIMKRMQSDDNLGSLVPIASQYPSTVPANRTFPFLRYGLPIVTPLRSIGLDSSSLRVTIHGFTKAQMAGDAITATAEDMAYDIGSAIKDCLDGSTLDIGGGMKARVTWLSTTPRADPDERDAWATSVTFSAEVSG